MVCFILTYIKVQSMPSRIGESEGVEEGPSEPGSTWDCVALFHSNYPWVNF